MARAATRTGVATGLAVSLVAGPVGALAAGCRVVPDHYGAGAGGTADSPDTLFGSNVWQAPGESRAEALARRDAAYGPVEVVRVFSPWWPPPWPLLRADLGDRPVVASFRMLPSRVLSGADDARLLRWFRNAPRDRDTWWVYFHEPEDDIERGSFTAEEFVAAWQHVAGLAAQAGNPRLHATLVLMCWTASEHSGRNWRDYVPSATGESSPVDVLAWDCYAHGDDPSRYSDVRELLDPARAATAELGADWAVAEVGARLADDAPSADRAAWLVELGSYAVVHGARFVTYFDAPVGGDFRLDDPESVAAWGWLVARERRRSRVTGREGAA